MSKNNLEIPIGKRTFLYRLLEILPGFLSYAMIILLFVFSFINPILGSIYLLAIIVITLVKAIGVAVRTCQGYNVVESAKKVDWNERYEDLSDPHEAYERLCNSSSRAFEFGQHLDNLRLMLSGKKGDFPDPKSIYHAVIMVAYDEGLETLIPSVEAVKNTTFDNEKIIFVLAYEERGGEQMEENAKKLKEKFKGVFKDFLIIKHPDGLKNEIKGKGPNLVYAGKELQKYVDKKNIDYSRVIITSLDSDNRMDKGYLSYVAYEYVVHEDRKRLSYQPVSLFTNNIWDAPAPMRVIAVSNSFFNVINTMRPHALRNFASHSQPMDALVEMGFWSKRTIVEDGHQYWRSFFHFKGDYEVISIKVPMYQDAVLSETLPKTLKAQFIQLRRWDYGASDVAYVGNKMIKNEEKISFWNIFPKFVRLLDGHVTLAAMSPIVAFGGWIPSLVNRGARDLVAYNLPATVSVIQFFASIGLMITILLSLRMLPKRPAKYKKHKTIMMVLQWVLMPVVAIVYQSFAAFYSQTRLMLGKYMENFDVTKKVVK